MGWKNLSFFYLPNQNFISRGCVLLSPQPKLYLPGVCPADCLQISGPCDTIDHLFPYIPFPHSKTPSSGPHPLDLPPWGLTMPVGRQCTIQRSGAAQRTVSFGSSFFGGLMQPFQSLRAAAARRTILKRFFCFGPCNPSNQSLRAGTARHTILLRFF